MSLSRRVVFVPLLLAVASAPAWGAKKKDEPSFYPIAHTNSVTDDRGAEADRVPDLQSFEAVAVGDGLKISLRLHEDIPVGEHLLRVMVALKEGKEAERAIPFRAGNKWVSLAGEEKKADAPPPPKEKNPAPKDPFPREVGGGNYLQEGRTYTATIPWSALPEGSLWVWVESSDWDSVAREIAEHAKKTAEPPPANTSSKGKKEEEKPMEKLNLSDRSPNGDQVLEIERPAVAPPAGSGTPS